MSGEVPRGWRVVRLGDVARESRARNADLEIPPQRLVGVFKDQGMQPMRERVRGASIERCKVVEPGAFAYNPMRINIGSIARSDSTERLLVSPDYVVFEPNEAKIDGAFLDLLRKSESWAAFVGHAGDGGVRIRIYFDHLAEFRFPLPPLPEQRRIAEVLSSVDEAIAATRAVIEQTRKVKQAALEALFHRGNWSDASLPPGHRLISLEEIARRGSGHTPSKKFSEYWDGEIKWISLQDTKSLDHRFVKETSARISELGIRNSSAEVHAAGTVFVSRDATVGKVGIMEVPMAVSQHFIAWTCGPLLNNIFLYYWLLNMRPIFDRIAAGSTIKTIGLSFFKELKITVPDVETQQRIVSKMMSLDDGLDASEKCFKSSISLKSALMSDLLTGRKRVSDPLTLAAE
ncbi:restriction endonuclease subunit S [Xanthobacter autotrophicus]|uniref:restriction endonuclease subunit S n=1 Tax=Xanthobacter autotrophicus TaxID=280 RepID=UPI003727AEB3